MRKALNKRELESESRIFNEEEIISDWQGREERAAGSC